MAAMYVTVVKGYQSGKLKDAMLAMAEEANEVHGKGYTLVGFQVVESEKQIAGLYRRAAAPAAPGATLVGE